MTIHCTITAESKGENFLKIGQHLPKIRAIEYQFGFWARRDSIQPNSYGDVAGWLSVTASIVSKRLNLS